MKKTYPVLYHNDMTITQIEIAEFTNGSLLGFKKDGELTFVLSADVSDALEDGNIPAGTDLHTYDPDEVVIKIRILTPLGNIMETRLDKVDEPDLAFTFDVVEHEYQTASAYVTYIPEISMKSAIKNKVKIEGLVRNIHALEDYGTESQYLSQGREAHERILNNMRNALTMKN